MKKPWDVTEDDREWARLANKIVEELEKKIGRKLDPNDPILLSILSSHPDAPFEPLLPPPAD